MYAAQEILRPSLMACRTSVWPRQVVTPPRALQQEHLRTRKYGATLGTMFGDVCATSSTVELAVPVVLYVRVCDENDRGTVKHMLRPQ